MCSSPKPAEAKAIVDKEKKQVKQVTPISSTIAVETKVSEAEVTSQAKVMELSLNPSQILEVTTKRTLITLLSALRLTLLTSTLQPSRPKGKVLRRFLQTLSMKTTPWAFSDAQDIQ